MRFLHLADLHLGKSIHGISMIDNRDQIVWKDRFIERVRELRPDAVVIAGDIYDRSAPSGEAVLLFDNMLTALEDMKIPVMLVAGNHDSGQRLSFGGNILAKQNIHIGGILEKELTHVTIPDQDGSVTFWLMPYLFPALAAQKLEDDTVKDYDTAVRRLLEEQDIDYSQRNVLVAHQNVTAGGQEAERGGSESMVGGVGQVDYTAFDGFDYAALGHIHASYPVGRNEVRYAGSPLCYHFNETKQPRKGPLLVEIGEKGTELRIEPQIIEPLHPMREIKGTFEEIRTAEENSRTREEYLKIVITDRRITAEMAEYFRELFRRRGSVVMELVSEYQAYSAQEAVLRTDTGEQRLVEEYFAELYRERKLEAEPGEKDLELFRFIGEQVRHANLQDKKELVDKRDVDCLLDYILKQEA